MSFWRPTSPLAGLTRVKAGRSRRESSWDRTGGNRDFAVVPPGGTHVLADITGTGVIEHIWLTTRCYSEKYLRKLVIEMYWDGEENPSVRSPLGDFFGVGHATCTHYVSLPLSMVFGPRRGPKGPFAAAMNSYFPMPFGKSAKIVIRNESDKPIENLFYYVDYDLTDEAKPDDVAYFHAYYRQEKPCVPVPNGLAPGEVPNPWDLPGVNLTGDDNYVILDTDGGAGHYVGCVLSIDNHNASNQPYTWPGEGDDMIFIDGEQWPPSLHGTGTEDYFNAAWGFPSGAYAGPYHGISLASSPQEHFGLWSMYRFHIEDPVRFSTSIKVTIEHGHANDQGNDFSSVAYWYQHHPHKPLPELPPVAERLPRRWPEHGLWDE
ncbi:glycoside hydrolase family 172 protein [Micromonospora sp. NPDC018662]|uniref:glycoside hydrolase family 172 protein n=1 Tax=Micromonospora sp. NPDC018662 TaxID=3364238 RepID=UPI0037A1F381